MNSFIRKHALSFFYKLFVCLYLILKYCSIFWQLVINAFFKYSKRLPKIRSNETYFGCSVNAVKFGNCNINILGSLCSSCSSLLTSPFPRLLWSWFSCKIDDKTSQALHMLFILQSQTKLWQNKTKWIWIYDREKRRYKSNRIDILS